MPEEEPGRSAQSRLVVRIDGHGRRRVSDVLAGEEPLEVRVDGQPLSVTMRTPGHDFEMALGFCLGEGVVEHAGEVERISYCGHDGTYNVVDVIRRSPEIAVDPRLRRDLLTTSACGVCGTTSIDLVAKRCCSLAGDGVRVAESVLAALPFVVRAEQQLFHRTGGLHAAAIVTATGELKCLREDVGRHNAVDKAIGWAAMNGQLPLAGHILFVSGRVAFEIVQKAAVAGVPVVAAVSAPTSLAVRLAESLGMTLVGFLRDETMNVYTEPERVT